MVNYNTVDRIPIKEPGYKARVDPPAVGYQCLSGTLNWDETAELVGILALDNILGL